jgi:4-hydroxy-3-methylbut-2-enyl diphosphate reductase
VALAHGAGAAFLLSRAAELDLGLLDGVERLGITAGASTPEELVQELIEELKRSYAVEIEEVTVTKETTHFKLPRELREMPAL